MRNQLNFIKQQNLQSYKLLPASWNTMLDDRWISHWLHEVPDVQECDATGGAQWF